MAIIFSILVVIVIVAFMNRLAVMAIIAVTTALGCNSHDSLNGAKSCNGVMAYISLLVVVFVLTTYNWL